MKRSSLVLVLGLAGAAGLGLAAFAFVGSGNTRAAPIESLPKLAPASVPALPPVRLEAVDTPGPEATVLTSESGGAGASDRISVENPAAVQLPLAGGRGRSASVEQVGADDAVAAKRARQKLQPKQAGGKQQAGGKPGFGKAASPAPGEFKDPGPGGALKGAGPTTKAASEQLGAKNAAAQPK